MLEDIDSHPRGWLWGVQEFSGGSNCRCGGNSKELELEVETEDVTEFLQSCDKIVMNAPYGWANKPVSGDGVYSWWRCCQNFWKTTKHFEYHVNLVDKTAAGFDSNFEISSVHAIEQHFMLQRNRSLRFNQCKKLHLCLILGNCHSNSRF